MGQNCQVPDLPIRQAVSIGNEMVYSTEFDIDIICYSLEYLNIGFDEFYAISPT